MINLNPTFQQLAQRKIAFFVSTTLGNDLYYLKEFIDIMINVYGEENLIKDLSNDKNEVNKKMGLNWGKFKSDLKKMDKLIEETKAIYDLLEDKTMKKKSDKDVKLLLGKAKKISVIKPNVYSLFVFLVNNTSLSRMSIPQEYYKILEHRGSKPMLGFEKKRVPVSTN